MKKILALIMAMMLLFTLAACGGEPEEEKKTDSDSQTQEHTIEGGTTQQEEETTEKAEDEKDEAIVVVDNEECFISITGFGEDDFWGYGVNVSLENKSDEITYMFAVDYCTVNGVMVSPIFASEVTPGKKANDSVSIGAAELEEIGIEKCTDIEIGFRVYDTNDWNAEPVAEEVVHVYPYGEAAVEKFEREPQTEDKVVVDNGDVTIIITGIKNDDVFEMHSLNLYLVNNTDKEIMVSIESASVNGYMLDPFYADSVKEGKCKFSDVDWYNDDLEEQGITEIEEIEFTIRVYDYADWTADDIYYGTVVYNP